MRRTDSHTFRKRASGVNADRIEEEAAKWALRIEEGLSHEDDLALSDWLEADPEHKECLQAHRATWARVEPLAAPFGGPGGVEDPTSMESASGSFQKLRHRWRAASFALAASAAAGLIAYVSISRVEIVPFPPVGSTVHLPPACQQLTLSDGTEVDVNRGGAVEEHYTGSERRIRLLRGEAVFTVVRDVERPFVVEAGGVAIRALGTVFNVKMDERVVAVTVTAGKVRVEEPPASPAANISVLPMPVSRELEAGQATAVSWLAGKGTEPVVVTLSLRELEAKLAWKPTLLYFENETMAKIVNEFNRRNPVQLIVEDPTLQQRRMTATFRSDNVEGLVRVLDRNYGIKAEARAGGSIALTWK